VDREGRVVWIGGGVDFLRDLIVQREAGQPLRGGKAETSELRRSDELRDRARLPPLGADLDLDAPPSPASQLDQNGEPSWLDDPGWRIDDVNLAAAQGQRAPGELERLVERREERLDVSTHQSVQVAGGPRGKAEAMLKQRSALEEEPA